jgi:N-dimethylarginine dimethylaminohydrolase
MSKNLLMCAPDYFDIEYEINVWMSHKNQVAEETAEDQWHKLYKIYTEQLGWNVKLIEPVRGLPDMVFATDCCLMIDDKVLLSSFRYPERQPETEHFKKWFRANGYRQLKKAVTSLRAAAIIWFAAIRYWPATASARRRKPPKSWRNTSAARWSA